MSSLTRAALIFASVLAVLFGVSMAPSAQAATLCDSACILQQLQSHNFVPVPPGAGVRTVAADGSMLYYTGPNGLEIRLSHDKTTEVIKNSSDLAIAIGSFADGGDAAAVVMKIFPAWVPHAARAAGILNQPIQDFFHIDFTTTAIKAMQRDLCLGVTLEPNSVGTILSRPFKAYAAMLQGNLGGAAAAMAGIRAVWFEPCSLNRGQLSDAIKPGTLADIGLAPAPPAAAPAPVTPAQYITSVITGYSVAGTCRDGSCGLKVRTGPGYTNYAQIGTLYDGNPISIICQGPGQRVSNGKYFSDIWDKIVWGNDSAWITDFYTNTPGVNVYLPGAAHC
jgi:hypothetical protein